MTELTDKIETERKRRNLSARISETQWVELLTELQTELLEARLKWLFQPQPGDWSGTILLPMDGYLADSQFGTISLPEVEWLELKAPARKDLEGLEPRIQTMRLPYSYEGEHLRIWGYSPTGMN